MWRERRLRELFGGLRSVGGCSPLRGGRLQGLLRPQRGFAVEAGELWRAEAIGFGDLIAGLPVAAFVALEPAEQAALVVIDSAQSLPYFMAQGQSLDCLFDGQPQHGRQQTEESKQVLFGR